MKAYVIWSVSEYEGCSSPMVIAANDEIDAIEFFMKERYATRDEICCNELKGITVDETITEVQELTN